MRETSETHLGSASVMGNHRGRWGQFRLLAIWALGACGEDGTGRRPWAALGMRKRLCCPFSMGTQLESAWEVVSPGLISCEVDAPQDHEGVAVNVSRLCVSHRAFLRGGEAPASSFHCIAGTTTFLSLRINWLILQSALKMQSAVSARDVSGPTRAVEGEGAEGAMACSLHSKFHDCFWKLCSLIYKSCQRNKLNGITRWP